jgi:hypothetical protein
VADVTGQKLRRVRSPRDASVGEVVDGLLGRMHLPATDSDGQVLTYHARLEREGRHMHRSEIVGDVVQENDRVTLQPDIDAG